MRTGPLVVSAIAVLLSACQQPQASTPAEAQPAAAFAPDRTIGTHTATGVLLAVEDTGFPLFSVEVGPAGSTAGADGNLFLGLTDPVAGGPVDPATLRPLIGQTVQVRYTVSSLAQMSDILIDGRSVMTPVEGMPREAGDSKTMTGILSDAVGESGDLPSELTVTAADGTAVTFEAFLEPGLTNANGKTVTLRYTDGTSTELVSVTPAA